MRLRLPFAIAQYTAAIATERTDPLAPGLAGSGGTSGLAQGPGGRLQAADIRSSRGSGLAVRPAPPLRHRLWPRMCARGRQWQWHNNNNVKPANQGLSPMLFAIQRR